MENGIVNITAQRLGALFASAALIYAFFWWKKRKSKKEKSSVPDEQKKEESVLSGVWNYFKWRFKIAIITIIVLVILYFILS